MLERCRLRLRTEQVMPPMLVVKMIVLLVCSRATSMQSSLLRIGASSSHEEESLEKNWIESPEASYRLQTRIALERKSTEVVSVVKSAV